LKLWRVLCHFLNIGGKIANSLILQGGKRYISHYFIINATKAMECSLRGITTGKPLMNRPRPTTQTNGTIIMGLRYLGEKNAKLEQLDQKK
jgi:hypothetical protein